jgi:hypothetical protein
MKSITLLFLLLTFKLLAVAQTGNDFKEFDINGSKMTVGAVSMKVVDKTTNKVVFDGYKQGRVTIENISADPTLATIEIDLGGYFSLRSDNVYQLNVEYKESGTTIATYTIIDNLNGNKMASVAFYYVHGELKSVWIITTPDIKNSKKGLTVTLTGLEMNTEKGIKLGN